jgi:PHD/YefM family antitoxin component YafN of YafNO toxin-antitoxin module
MKIRFGDSKPASGEDRRLCTSAERIAVLLERAQSRPSRALKACLDDLLGAIYSLLFASRNGFDDRTEKELDDRYYKDVSIRAADMSSGSVRTDGKWAAGYYFNSGVLRIDAVCHRGAETVASPRKGFDNLRKPISDWFQSTQDAPWAAAALQKIGCEARALKHRTDAVIPKRNARFADAVDAIGELIVLFEAFQNATHHPLDITSKEKPEKVALDTELWNSAQDRACELGKPIAEYIRDLIEGDILQSAKDNRGAADNLDDRKEQRTA